MRAISKLFLFVISIFLINAQILSAEELSPATEKAYAKVQKIDQEIGSFGRQASELILHTSYLQDILLAYLHDAESQEAYQTGMQLFHSNFDSLDSVCKYVTTIYNFYTGEYDPPSPQEVSTTFNGKKVTGFLNTFKINRELTAQERSKFFEQEATHYAKDAVVHPFILDSTTLDDLQPETLYNFVLLPDNTIRLSLERPGDREYHVRDEITFEAFRYPNHTILAKEPECVVVSAGALLFYQIDDKRLYFISSKSGHFQPTYSSLVHMQTQLAALGINPYTIVSFPDVDMSLSVIKTYKGAQVPVLVTQNDTAELFQIANDRWTQCYNKIDKTIIQELAQGNTAILNPALNAQLKSQRAEATYMRSAYHLFTHDRVVPPYFSELVKRFGKLKDAIKRVNTPKFDGERVKQEAQRVLMLMDNYNKEVSQYTFRVTDNVSGQKVIVDNFNRMQALLAQESLSKEEYHDLKKLARETGALFMYKTINVQYKGRGFFIYRTAAQGFFQINDLMASTDYVYAPSHGDEIRLKVPRKIFNMLTKYLARLGIAPSKFAFVVDPKDAFWVVNYAKDVYHISHIVQEIFRNIAEDTPIDTFRLEERLEVLKRSLDRAGNIMLLLDRTHKVPDAYPAFKKEIEKMIGYVQNEDFASIRKEADAFWHLCYSVPSSGLNVWECTDHPSFDNTLNQVVRELLDLKRTNLKKIEQAAQIIRDFINLSRKNGLSKAPNALPMVCFDALEENADILLEEIKHGRITKKMQTSASFIIATMLPESS